MKYSSLDPQLQEAERALSYELARERMLRRIVQCLSVVLSISMAGWALYFWHLFKVYSFFRK